MEISILTVAEVQGAMLSKVLEGAGVVDTLESTINGFPSPRCGVFSLA